LILEKSGLDEDIAKILEEENRKRQELEDKNRDDL
jgi:hypothetical protein